MKFCWQKKSFSIWSYKIIHILIILISFFFTSCKPTATLKQGEYLLDKNYIKTNRKEIDKKEVISYIKQKPNRKILGIFRFHLAVYNLGSKPFPPDIEIKFRNTPIIKKYVDNIIAFDSTLKYNIRNVIGEAPVILDTNLTNASAAQIRLYLQNKGYFNSIVKTDFLYKKKKVNVSYIINAPEPYYLDNISYIINDPVLEGILKADSKNALIKKGDIYDVDKFDQERTRISNSLRKHGYYLFTKDYIKFKIDTNLSEKNKMNVELVIGNYLTKSDNDSLIQIPHKRFLINKIWIYPDYYPLAENDINNDTTIVETKRKKSSTSKRVYYFVHKGELKIKPIVITQSIFINPGDYFNIDDANLTYNRLSELRNFRRITIQFDEVMPDSIKKESKEYYLDCRIMLPYALQQAISFEAQGTNTGGNLGVGGVIQYENKNIFGGAEIFNFKLTGETAIQKVFGEFNETNVNPILPFNTLEVGGEAKLTLPWFLVPVSPERFSRFFRPKTTINTGYNYQKRPDYTRYIANAAFGYEWRESSTKKHLLNPLELNFIKIYPSSSFKERINSIQNAYIRNTYQNHLITLARWDFYINTQSVSSNGNFSYFKIGLESAGLLMRLGNIIFNSAKSGESFSILGIKYTQYIRTNLDYRYYINGVNKRQLASRIFVGVGVPYGNSNELPFEKNFYAGGANSIRAWKLKTLGPGSYYDPLKINLFERMGDIAFESNIEYRFPIYKILDGALFIDAGNVWLLKENAEFDGGKFRFDKAPGEIAIGSGIGARFNFGFFIVRFDAAIPLKDPSKPVGQRWLFNNLSFNKIIGNIGIGYPF